MNQEEIPGAPCTATVIRLLEAGAVVDGRYRLINSIGEGGSGRVFKALEVELERIVTVKILQNGLHGDAEGEARFLREGKILSTLSHTNIVTFYRFGFWNDQAYIAMEHVDGQTLESVIGSHGRLPVDRTLRIGVQICEGMAVAHRDGIVHRDLKPANVMLVDNRQQENALPETAGSKETAKILDFGISFLTTPDGAVSQHLTQTGAVIGSLLYMSPEQCTGKKVDHRSDIYSLACILYEAISAEKLFDCDNPIGLLHKHVSERPKTLTEKLKGEKIDPAILSGIDAVLFKALSKDPEDRYQSMDEFKEDLQLILNGQSKEIQAAPVQAQRKGNPLLFWLLCASLVMGMVSVAFHLYSKSTEISDKHLRATLRSKSLLVAHTFPARYELESTSTEGQIDYCTQWLRKYGGQSVLQTATAHSLLVSALMRQNQGEVTTTMVGHAKMALSNYRQIVELWKNKKGEISSYDLYGIINDMRVLTRVCGTDKELAPFLISLLKHKDRLQHYQVCSILEELCYHYQSCDNLVEEEKWLTERIKLFETDPEGCRSRDLILLSRAQTELASLKRRQGDIKQANLQLTQALRTLLHAYGLNPSDRESSLLGCVISDLVYELEQANRPADALKVLQFGLAEVPSADQQSVYKMQIAELNLQSGADKTKQQTYLQLLRSCTSDYARWKSIGQICSLPEEAMPQAELIKVADEEFAKPSLRNIAYGAVTAANSCVERKTRSELVQHIIHNVVNLTTTSSPKDFLYLIHCANQAGYLLLKTDHMDEGSRFYRYLLERENHCTDDAVAFKNQMATRLSWASAMAVTRPAAAESILSEAESLAKSHLPESGPELADTFTLRAELATILGHGDEAAALVSKAIKITEKHPDDRHHMRALQVKAIVCEFAQNKEEVVLKRKKTTELETKTTSGNYYN